jgi:hypothetical protein
MANKPKDWEWQMVAVKSIKSLFVAIAGYMSYDNVYKAEHQISFWVEALQEISPPM